MLRDRRRGSFGKGQGIGRGMRRGRGLGQGMGRGQGWSLPIEQSPSVPPANSNEQKPAQLVRSSASELEVLQDQSHAFPALLAPYQQQTDMD